MINRRDLMTGTGLIFAGMLTKNIWGEGNSAAANPVPIDVRKSIGPLPHFWEKTAGSDRTVIGLRDQWRQDLVRVRRDTGIQSIRCHGLFNDEMGIAAGAPGQFNFLYVDQVYD